MKKNLFLIMFLTTCVIAFAQPGKKPAQQKAPSQAEINKMMEDAMKAEGMSKQEQEEVKKMMQGVMPALMEQNANTADYPQFSDNKLLVPKKDAARIAAMSKRTLSRSDIAAYATSLYNKLLAKGDAADIAIVKKILAQTSKASVISNAVVLCMMQGHPHAAMLLSMKAVMAEPSNIAWQNNMASLLTQYGYPEQAMPVLRKLYVDAPGNSTVLNNLAYAWLGLGVTDSVRFFAAAAVKVNPFNPDAKMCGGLMEELIGDPIKAGQDYTESFEDGINPFTENVMKNQDAQNKSTSLDFEKIKRSIAIHEYFKKDFISDIPLLKGGVSNYAYNQAIKEGYRKMMDTLTLRIEDMNMVLGKKLENLADGNEEDFVNEMTAEMKGGRSMMSLPASTVIQILITYKKQWHERLLSETGKMTQKIAGYRKEMDAITSKNWTKENCKVADQAIDEFTNKVNPMVHKYFLQKAEELRQWSNALCTWNWYVSGNIKNVVLMQDIEMTGYLVQMYEAAVKSQEVINGYCETQQETDSKHKPVPEIPNFTCPAVVSIPTGQDWSELPATVKNFDNNNWGVKKTNKPVPHTSISFTTGGRIGQPGFDAGLKTANGTVTADHVNISERSKRLEQMHKENMEMLDAMPDYQDYRHKKNLEMIKELPYWSEILAIKALISKMMSTPCDDNKKKKKPKFVVVQGELTFEPLIKSNLTKEYDTEQGHWMEFEDGTRLFYGNDGSVFEIGRGELTFEESASYEVVEADHTVTFKKTPPNPQDKNLIKLKEFKSNYDANGLTPSLSSSMQAPGLFNRIADLFK